MSQPPPPSPPPRREDRGAGLHTTLTFFTLPTLSHPANSTRQTMHTVVTQPMVVQQTMMLTQHEDWGSGICDCCDDMGICCFAYWCFPCFQCHTADRFGECLCLPLLDSNYLASFGVTTVACAPAATMAMRTAIRERYKIPGSIFSDCCVGFWYPSCTWCQMAREMKRRKQPVSIVTAQTTTVNVPLNPQPQVYHPYPPYQVSPSKS